MKMLQISTQNGYKVYMSLAEFCRWFPEHAKEVRALKTTKEHFKGSGQLGGVRWVNLKTRTSTTSSYQKPKRKNSRSAR